MESKAQQIGLIGNILDQVNGLDTETKDRIDLEAEIDPELSVSENWEQMKDKYGIRPEGKVMEELNNHREMSDEEYYEEEKKTLASEHSIDPENLKDFRELTSGEDYRALDYWSKKINPKVTDMENVKKAVLLSLASHGDEYGDRGRIHVLLSGDPGTAKSEVRMWIAHRLGAETISQRTSKVGLSGDARGDEITPGALPRADGGVIAIDELDEFKPRDRQGLLESMSEGIVNIEAGGMSAEFQARCRVLACANNTDNFSPELMDRFDFHFELETPEEKEQKNIMENIVDGWFRKKEGYQGIELRQYLSWIKPFKPDISPETREKVKELIQYHIELEDQEKTSVRQKESLLRIAYTIAKLNRRDLKVEDVLKAIELKHPDMNSGRFEALQMKVEGL